MPAMMAAVSVRALDVLAERVMKINHLLGQCVECETALEDMHPTSCRTGAALLEARFALMSAWFKGIER